MKPAKLDTYPVAYVEGLAARVAELEAENKDLRKRAELADGDVKRAQAILDASSRYIRRLEVDLQSESQAKIDAEFHVAALKERLAELEARTREAEESNANALARFSAAEATIELRRIENEAVRHQVWHAENVCDAMEKRIFDTDARCKRLEEAMELVAQMRQRWLEAADNGYAGAYYAFVKNKDDEWDAIMQAKEAKP